MTDIPVFAIHGIANRSPDEFAARVAHLAAATGRNIHPVYWGHLGADHRYVPLVVPAVPNRPGSPVRSAQPEDAGTPGYDDLDLLAVALVGTLGGRNALDEVLHGIATAGAHPSGTEALREDQFDATLADALREAWLDEPPEWLPSIDNPELLREFGASIARTASELLSLDDTVSIRSPERVREVVGAVLRQTDRVAAATMSTAGARFLWWVRTRGAEGVALNAGDMLGYQRHRDEILTHVRARIGEVAGSDAGTDAEHPVHLVGHSLGGVIALDLVTSPAQPVHAASVVTFGTHWPLLHLWHPDSAVPRFDGQPVSLPPAVRRWTNLWERLDMFAYLAAPVLTLADGRPVRDVELRQSATLFSHSTYWESPILVKELLRAWRRDD